MSVCMYVGTSVRAERTALPIKNDVDLTTYYIDHPSKFKMGYCATVLSPGSRRGCVCVATVRTFILVLFK